MLVVCSWNVGLTETDERYPAFTSQFEAAVRARLACCAACESVSEALGLVAKPVGVWRLASQGRRDSEVEGALVPEEGDVVRRAPKGSGSRGYEGVREGAREEAAATWGTCVEKSKRAGRRQRSRAAHAPSKRAHREFSAQSAAWPNRTATYSRGTRKTV